MVLFEFSREIAIIHGDAEGIAQAVWPQVSKGVDSLEASAIREMKRGDGIVELTVLTHLREVSESEALERPGKNFAVSERLFEQVEEGFDRLAPAATQPGPAA